MLEEGVLLIEINFIYDPHSDILRYFLFQKNLAVSN